MPSVVVACLHRAGRIAVAALALIGAVGAARAACVNSLSNPGFDLGTTGWDTAASGGGASVYLVAAPDDRAGDPGEYAALVTNDSSGAGSSAGTFPLEANFCAGVTPGEQVRIRGWIWVPAAQPTTGFASIALRWSQMAHCAGTLSWANTTQVSAPGGWTFVQDVVTAPPGVDSLAVGLSVTKDQAGGSYFTYFDDLELCVPEPASLSCGGAALAALAACRQRRRSASGAPHRPPAPRPHEKSRSQPSSRGSTCSA